MMKTDHIVSLITRIRENANRFLLQELKRQGIEGLAPSHGDILAILYHSEMVSMAELAKRIHRDNSTVTVLVDKLVAFGYVTKQKDPSDRRVTYVRLTEKGKAFHPLFQEISKKLLLKIYHGFSDLEQEMLVRLLERISSNWE